MKRVWRLRAMGSLSRQWTAYNPVESSKLLAHAEYCEKLAAAELADIRRMQYLRIKHLNPSRSREFERGATAIE
jgi:hypothetical protein